MSNLNKLILQKWRILVTIGWREYEEGRTGERLVNEEQVIVRYQKEVLVFYYTVGLSVDSNNMLCIS
jgi:hypothetical protein